MFGYLSTKPSESAPGTYCLKALKMTSFNLFHSGADGIDLLKSIGPSPPRVTLQVLQNQLAIATWFFIFLHSYECKHSSSSENKKHNDFSLCFAVLAVRTGLEQKF